MRASADDDHQLQASASHPVAISVHQQKPHGQPQDRSTFNAQSDQTDSTSIVALNLPIIATEAEDAMSSSSPLKPPRLRHRSSLTVPVSPHCLTVSPTPSFSSSSETLTGSHQLLSSVDDSDQLTSAAEIAPPSSPVSSQRRSLVSSLFGGLKGKINSSGSTNISSSAVASSTPATPATTSHHVAVAKSPPISPSLPGASQRRSYLHHHHHRWHQTETETSQLDDLPSDDDRNSSSRRQVFHENQIEALALSPATSPKFSRLTLAKAKLSSNAKSHNASYSLLTTGTVTSSGRDKSGSSLPSPSSISAVGFFQNFRRATSPTTFQFPEDSFNQQQQRQRRPPALYQLQQRHQLHVQSQPLKRQLAVSQPQQSDYISPPLCSSCGGVARDAGDTSLMTPLAARGSSRKRSPSPINFSYSSPSIIINNSAAAGASRSGSAFVGGRHRLQHSGKRPFKFAGVMMMMMIMVVVTTMMMMMVVMMMITTTTMMMMTMTMTMYWWCWWWRCGNNSCGIPATGKHVTYDVDLTNVPTTTSMSSSSTLSSSAPSSAYSSSSSSTSVVPTFPPPSSSSSSTIAKAKAGTVVTSSRASKRR